MWNTGKQSGAGRSGGAGDHWSGLESLEGRLLLAAIDISMEMLPLVTNDNTPTLEGTVSDPAADVSVALVPSGSIGAVGIWDAVSDGLGGWTLTLPELDDGTYDVWVAASANSGADQGQVHYDASLTVDTVADVTVDDLASPVAAATLTGTVGADVETMEATVDGTTYTTGASEIVFVDDDGGRSWSLELPELADGDYVVSVTAVDALGNSNTVEGLLIIDTVEPTVAFDDDQLPAAVNADVTLTGTFEDANIDSIVVTLDDGQGGLFDFEAAIDTDAKTWTAEVPIVGLADGEYSVSVTATDIAGHSATENAAGPLTVDTVAEVGVDDVASPVDAATVTGTVGADVATLEVTVFGTTYTWALGQVVVVGTDWSLDLPVLADDSYVVSVTATDAVGNSNTVEGQLIIDTTEPTVAFDDDQFPAVVNDDVTLTGTFEDANIDSITVTLDDGQGGTFDFEATIDTDAKTWSAEVSLGELEDGVYTVSVTATDLVGYSTTELAAGPLTKDTAAPTASTATAAATSDRPALSGTVDDPDATVVVTIRGLSYPATNDGGAWSIPADTIAALPDGLYRVTVTATDVAGNQHVFNDALLIVDTTAPAVTVDRLVTTDASPALGGTVSDAAAVVVVTVDGESYNAVNNGDGTWSLAADVLAELDQGVYDVGVTATDAMGHVGADASTNELTIAAAQSVVLGDGVYKVTYVDADGTTVTISSGRGGVSVDLVGVNLAVAGTGRARTVTADGGVLQADIEVLANTSSLTIRTNAGGDGVTAINRITGDGVLGTLSAKGVNVVGGIDMAGVIRNLRVHGIHADVVMGAWAKGVIIAADVFRNSTIQTASIKILRAYSSYQNTNVMATSIGSVLLYNVAVDNGGAAFGLQADKIGSLTLRQAGSVLKWKKHFTDGIVDLLVLV